MARSKPVHRQRRGRTCSRGRACGIFGTDAASGSSTDAPLEQDAADASPKQRALVRLVSKLATGGERGFVQPESPAGAVQWLADELLRNDLSPVDRTFTFDAIKVLLGEGHGNYCRLEHEQKHVLIRAVWQHSRKEVANAPDEAIKRGLQLLATLGLAGCNEYGKKPKSLEELELLEEIRRLQGQHPERWQSDNHNALLPLRSYFSIGLELVDAMNENGRPHLAVDLLMKVKAECDCGADDKKRRDRWIAWSRACKRPRDTLLEQGDLDACEDLWRESLAPLERLFDPTESLRIGASARFVSFLTKRGKLSEAETRQRALVDACRKLVDADAAERLELLEKRIDDDKAATRRSSFWRETPLWDYLDGVAGAGSSRGHSCRSTWFEEIGLFQLLKLQGRREEAQGWAPAMLDHYFSAVSCTWGCVWIGPIGPEYLGTPLPRSEPMEWAVARERLEELLGTDAVQAGMEARFTALVPKLVETAGATHESSLFVRARQAFVLSHYRKLDEACSLLEALLADYGSCGHEYEQKHFDDSSVPQHERQAYCVFQALEDVLEKLGRGEERRALIRRSLEAQGDPQALANHDDMSALVQGVKSSDWPAVNGAVQRMLERDQAKDKPPLFYLQFFGNLIAWSMSGHLQDAEPLLRQALDSGKDRHASSCSQDQHVLDLVRVLYVMAKQDLDTSDGEATDEAESRLEEAQQLLVAASRAEDVTRAKSCTAVYKLVLSLVLEQQAAILEHKAAKVGDPDDATAAIEKTSSESRARQRCERLDKLSTATQLVQELVACHNGADACAYCKSYHTFQQYGIGCQVGPFTAIPTRDECCKRIADLLRQQERYEEADDWWEDTEEGEEWDDDDEDDDEGEGGEEEGKEEMDATDEEQPSGSVPMRRGRVEGQEPAEEQETGKRPRHDSD